MNEHDSLVSHALNNLSSNELAQEYANVRMEYKKLHLRHEAAFRAITKIAYDRPMFEEGSRHEYERAYDNLKTIANDALEAWERT